MIFGRIAIALAALGLITASSHAQFIRHEVLPVETENLSVADVLSGTKGTKQMLAGLLRVAKAGPKQPVVILMHGAGGLGLARSPVDEWSRVLNEAGYSTFAVDGFAGRGINTPADLQRLPTLTRIRDVFAAREVLAKHPLIDPDKIAVMGFSHGGPAALFSNLERFQKQHGSAKFAAHISMYGVCGTRIHDEEGAVSPVLILHGTAEDWVPFEPCQEYAARLTKAGKNARFIPYEGAYHVFDSPGFGKVRNMPDATTTALCRHEEVEGGLVNVATKKPFVPTDACVKKGVTAGLDEAAMLKAHGDVKAFLGEVFK